MLRRSSYIRRFISTGLIAGITCCAQAQSSGVLTEIRLRADSVFLRHDSLFALLDGGENIGLRPGLMGTYNNLIDKDRTDGAEIAFGIIQETGTTKSLCYIKSTYNKAYPVGTGDVFTCKTLLAPKQQANIFYELSLYSIFFTSYYTNKPFYTLPRLIATDQQGLEDSIKKAIHEDLLEVYEVMKNNERVSDVFRKPLAGGRYKGKHAIEVMRDVTLKDIDNFLLYVKTFPAKYVGYNFRVAESFAAWVISEAPYSWQEVKRELLPVFRQSPKALRERAKPYALSVIGETGCKYLGQEAIDLSQNGKKAEAEELFAFAEALAQAVNDTLGKVHLQLYRSQFYQDNNEFMKAMAACDEGVKLCNAYRHTTSETYADYKTAEVKMRVKKAYCLYRVSKYREARTALQQATDALNKYRRVISEEDYLAAMARRYSHEGYFDYRNGDYTNAITSYRKAIAVNDSLNTFAANEQNADFCYQLGKIYNKQNKIPEALIMLAKSDSIYKSLNNETEQAVVLNEIGSSYFDLADYKSSIQYLEKAVTISLRLNDRRNAGYAKSTIGNAYWNQGDYGAATSAHLQAKELLSGNAYGTAYSWNQLGRLYQLSGRKNESLFAFDSSIAYYRSAGDSASLSDVYVNKGKVYYQDEHYRQAVVWYQLARQAAEKIPVNALFNMGHAWSELDTAKARGYFEECEQLSLKNGDNDYLFAALVALCRQACINGNTKKEAAYLARLEKLQQQLAAPAYKADLISLRGFIHEQKLQLDSALYYYQQALAIYDTVKKSSGIWERNSIARVQISRGEFRQAGEQLSMATRIAAEIEDNLGEGYSLVQASLLHSFLGEYAPGMKDNDQAIAIFSGTGNVLRLANAYVARGALLKGAGNFKGSVQSYFNADSIYKAEKTLYYRFDVLNNIGVTYFNQGDYANALKYFGQSATYLQTAVKDEAYILNKANIAECYFYQGKYNEAEKLLTEIYPLAESRKLNRISTSIAGILGKLYFKTGRLGEAEKYWLNAKESSFKSLDKENMVSSLVGLGKISAASGRTIGAEQYFRQAIGIVREYSVGGQGWVSYYETGLFYYDQKKYDSAIVHFKAAVEIVERNAENIFGGAEARELYNNDPRKADLYGKLVASLHKTNNEKEAWAYANRSNRTGLQVLSGPAIGSTGDAGKDEALKKLVELQQKKQALEKSGTDLQGVKGEVAGAEKMLAIRKQQKIVEAEYTSYIEKLVQQFPDLGVYFQKNVNPDNFYNYKGELPDDLAVMLYLLNGDELMIFTLTNEELSIYTAELNKGIHRAIGAFKAVTKNRGKASGTGAISVRSDVKDEDDQPVNVSFKEVSSELYNVLIGSVQDKIAGKKKLCIIPNGSLSNLAFQCLGKKMPDSSFHFLLEDYTVFYSNQLDIFKNSRDYIPVKRNLYSFAAFGVPDQTLHFNLDEVKSIGHILGSDSTVYADTRATEGNARRSLLSKKVIHFATHGTLNYSNFNLSYLKLLADKDTTGGNNGRLTLDEIKALPIPGCDMVVLSACETAVNNELVKGWNLSPANAFLQRKVKTVIATLWKVDDEATSILLKAYYTNLEKGMYKVDALRDAQATLSRDPRFSHPYYWGAFVLFGEWR